MAVGRAVANKIGGMRRGLHAAAVATTCRIGAAFFVRLLVSQAGLTGKWHARESYFHIYAGNKALDMPKSRNVRIDPWVLREKSACVIDAQDTRSQASELLVRSVFPAAVWMVLPPAAVPTSRLHASLPSWKSAQIQAQDRQFQGSHRVNSKEQALSVVCGDGGDREKGAPLWSHGLLEIRNSYPSIAPMEAERWTRGETGDRGHSPLKLSALIAQSPAKAKERWLRRSNGALVHG
ncbi:hypothetical protein QBC39DRAFT_413933 [Podospora conica]|nr:hypothetical protein QBC39DRAFT_413933 [Schizothecium conicum]